MTVRAVGQNEHSYVSTIALSTAAGMGTGYAMKYIYPVTKQENMYDKRALINYFRKITNKAKVKDLRENGIKSLAQDCFIKMIESKDKDAFTPKSLAKKVKALGGEESLAGKEFRAIIRNVNQQSDKMIKNAGIFHHIALKYQRPVIPFLIAGAGVGFLAGFTHNILRTDA